MRSRSARIFIARVAVAAALQLDGRVDQRHRIFVADLAAVVQVGARCSGRMRSACASVARAATASSAMSCIARARSSSAPVCASAAALRCASQVFNSSGAALGTARCWPCARQLRERGVVRPAAPRITRARLGDPAERSAAVRSSDRRAAGRCGASLRAASIHLQRVRRVLPCARAIHDVASGPHMCVGIELARARARGGRLGVVRRDPPGSMQRIHVRDEIHRIEAARPIV